MDERIPLDGLARDCFISHHRDRMPVVLGAGSQAKLFFLHVYPQVPRVMTRGTIRRTFAVVLWVIQTQCLLQIIVNRIRIILHDRKRGQQLMIGTFIAMSLINISVFCIWIPARMQISLR